MMDCNDASCGCGCGMRGACLRSNRTNCPCPIHLQAAAAAAAGSQRRLAGLQTHGRGDICQLQQRRGAADGSRRLSVPGRIVKRSSVALGAATCAVRNYDELVCFGICGWKGVKAEDGIEGRADGEGLGCKQRRLTAGMRRWSEQCVRCIRTCTPRLARTRVERRASMSHVNNDSSAPTQERARRRTRTASKGGDAARGACEITDTTGLPT